MPNVLDLERLIEPDSLAKEVSRKYVTFKQAKSKKEEQWNEIQRYVFAVDTKTTTNNKLPWRNSTTRPKLCQIRDNLHANYMAALFPSDRWFKWLPADKDSAIADKAKGIEAYMQTKLRECKFEDFVSKAVLDFIDYGNCFADVEYVRDTYVNDLGETVVSYVGPRPVRISPLDITFDITASSFERTPKIVRTLYSIGDLEKQAQTMPPGVNEEFKRALAKLKKTRYQCSMDKSDIQKSEAYVADGFSSINSYYSSGMVEFLTLEGDVYDTETKTSYFNHRIVIMDRAYVIEKKPIANWLGRSTKSHAGWRSRPDNLWAMGPLDNLVGMQYRIDHLENLKADVFDLIAFPPTKQKGYVEDWQWGPNERILMAEDADVEMMVPDTLVLNADQQIHELEQQMEEMAGAPREAMGIRSPGEKTAFEVDRLGTAASRMFENKIRFFESMFVEPLLNAMLEIARRNMDSSDVARTIDNDTGVTEFLTITREDITARGRLTPMGARHFATKNKLLQDLTTLANTPIYQDPAVSAHISGWQIAKLVEDAMDWGQYRIVGNNVRIAEQMETQKFMNAAQEQVLKTSMAPTESPDNADLTNELPTDQ